MPATEFDRKKMARWYATQHGKTDPGVSAVYFLPTDAPPREIRFVEVNELMGEIKDDSLEPLDFGVDIGSETAHKLLVLDVTPRQWKLILDDDLKLPPGWSLQDKKKLWPHRKNSN